MDLHGRPVIKDAGASAWAWSPTECKTGPLKVLMPIEELFAEAQCKGAEVPVKS